MLKNKIFKSFISINLLLSGLFCSSNHKSMDTTQILLVRHAEKQEGENPELSPKGKRRAIALANLTNAFEISAIYSSKYNRTLSTAKPLAKKLNIQINSNYSPVEYQKIFEDVMSNHQGQTVLIVGHSNTVPGMINHMLGEKKVADLNEDDFSNLYIINIQGNNKEVKKTSFEATESGSLQIKD